jgi:hypothetical protein
MAKDLLHDDEGNLMFKNGDFDMGESEQQHVGDIFLMQPGETKEFPIIGFGAINYIKSRISDFEFKRNLKLQLEYDNYKDANINTSKGIENLNIEI